MDWKDGVLAFLKSLGHDLLEGSLAMIFRPPGYDVRHRQGNLTQTLYHSTPRSLIRFLNVALT